VSAGEAEVLNAQQIETFAERGVLKLDLGFSEDLLSSIVEQVQPLYEPAHQQNSLLATRVQDAWRQLDSVRQLAVNAKVLAALEQLLERKPLPFQTLNFPVGTSQYPHSDSIHFNTVPAGYMVGVWVALEDIDTENGPLIYYPGSHKLPYYSMQDLGLEPGYSQYHAYEQRIQDVIVEHDLQPELGLARQGEAIIWHANLLHGGAARKDVNRSRHSQVTHYFFEGCEYYTPMESHQGKPRRRKPFWIPETPDFQLPPEPWERPLPVRALRKVLRGLGLADD
jgi:ectoine hydroxylase-related dioxygenase (phytanoyl-CoA dioxygenase family)